MSLERRKLLIAYGAKLVLTEGAQGHERRDRQSRGDRRLRSQPLRAAAAVQEPRQPRHPREDHRAGDLGRHRGRDRYFRRRRRHRRHDHRRLALHQTNQGQADPIRRRRADREPGAHPEARGRAAEARTAQDPGHRRGLRARCARSFVDRRRRAGQQRRGGAVRSAPDARRRHSLRHLLRRGGGGRGAARQAAGERGQDDRRHPARFGRALSELGAVRRACSTPRGWRRERARRSPRGGAVRRRRPRRRLARPAQSLAAPPLSRPDAKTAVAQDTDRARSTIWFPRSIRATSGRRACPPTRSTRSSAKRCAPR